ncbi:MAG TPA: Crp/Fnr family transcriptional regulator [Dermatophilaceae bacterium]|jgi:CRP-like cAMP-binding protein|nr:Crp/Fnr family transcriptional regulator [Dermatophilaceae bacterium]
MTIPTTGSVQEPFGLGGLRGLFEFIAGATLPDWETYAGSIRTIEVPARGLLFDIGDEDSAAYIVKRGCLRTAIVREGREWTTGFIRENQALSPMPMAKLASFGRPGTFTGTDFPSLLGIAEGKGADHRAIALDDTVVFAASLEVMWQLSITHPEWARMFFVMTLLQLAAAQKRERDLLTRSPEDRYRHFVQTNPDLMGKVAQKDIATYLGLTPVGLSRIVSRVRASGR